MFFCPFSRLFWPFVLMYIVCVMLMIGCTANRGSFHFFNLKLVLLRLKIQTKSQAHFRGLSLNKAVCLLIVPTDLQALHSHGEDGGSGGDDPPGRRRVRGCSLPTLYEDTTHMTMMQQCKMAAHFATGEGHQRQLPSKILFFKFFVNLFYF